ncbi:bifunctional oligoribonuclease/PAP phosphatase NrnA [Fulvivirga kasyanovii]|uniref:Bifunctional oligoribonuclease/PAP phosphatase NrnA n=1 Tax=Fulvivirga kasyanovii TaxID=396812 RepID=A0ABW9RS31_9BACT|nr:bifunctional oligoribonuclease/PAP phosphatase NrnA [Fulvivirga kasyanovii]MTI26836.1 bifunctional oligoribonuclease/PAP phosphatase NrnA [Fulvivirga kasyanovii]
MQNLEAFKTVISSPKKVVITTHHKPDADALGSSLGLAGYLKKKGHEVSVITPTDYANFLAWMKGNDEVIIFNEGNEEKSGKLISEADMIFCLDFSSLNRINELGEMVRQSEAVKVLIDHHLEPEDFADFVYWSTEAAATAELVYDLICDLGDKQLIDKDLAESLYAGIMTDTGSFKHPNTTKNVFNVCAELVEIGADTAKVSKLVYDTNSLDKVKFLGFALNEKLKVLDEFNTAYFAVSADELKRFNSKTGDTEGLVNYALSIEGIKFAAVIIDRTEAIKMSFRSIGDFSVNEFARKHFEGGGHKNASGGKSDLSLEETVKKFESVLNEYKNELSTKIKTYA